MATRPNDQNLSVALTALFANEPPAGRITAVLERRANSWASTFDSEVVTCRLGDGAILYVLCKYEQFRFPERPPPRRVRAKARRHMAGGHRRGNGYEAEVYRRVLSSVGSVAPRYFGIYRDDQSGLACIVLEYLDGAQHPGDRSGLSQVAGWLAQFHAAAETFASSAEARFLIRYDRDYYESWARRTAEFARPLHHRYPWVRGVCERFAEQGIAMLESQPTVIHGECYRKNVLIYDGRVWAIDWESCAVGAGEVDLAMLGEAWPIEVVTEIERRYVVERWPAGAPEAVARRLAMAKVYVQLRWLGEEPRTPSGDDYNFDELRRAGEHAGLL